MLKKRRSRQHLPDSSADRGATIVEYVLLISCIALLIVASLTLLGADLKGFFSEVASMWP
ncbi:MAG: Flp family type IVb pilin [Actinomycetota bacterium]